LALLALLDGVLEVFEVVLEVVELLWVFWMAARSRMLDMQSPWYDLLYESAQASHFKETGLYCRQ